MLGYSSRISRQNTRRNREGGVRGDFCADDARVACPLFQAEYGGSIPTSALQLRIGRIDGINGVRLNRLWHSRLPEIKNWRQSECYGAEFSNVFYAVAFWSSPSARLLNGRGMWELRRLAISPDAPRNTASRMLKVMAILIRREKPDVKTLISYQDTAVHTGAIYKASGWIPADCSGSQSSWNMPGRKRDEQATSGSVKVRWQLEIARNEPNPLFTEPQQQPKEQELKW